MAGMAMNSRDGAMRESSRAVAAGRILATVAFLSVMTPAAALLADPVAEFYDKKRILITVGGTSGGGYAVYARALANVLGDYVPGQPTVNVQYMPGASTIRAANYIFNVAKRDGTEIGAFQQPVFTIPFHESGGIQYENEKFLWLGSLGSDVSICFLRADAGISTLQEARETTVTIGANAPSASSTTIPTILNNLVRTRFKIISGYNGPDLALAIERNEVQGQCNSWSSVKSLRADWLKKKMINILVQLSAEKEDELPDVPLVMDFVNTAEERAALAFLFAPQKFGRPYAFPPGVPADRVAALRKALASAAGDPKLAEMYKKQNLEISFTDGERMQGLVADLSRTPRAVVERAIKAATVPGAAKEQKGE